ncbi:hypothetical protein EIZ52_25280, partial [Pandoraea apista]
GGVNVLPPTLLLQYHFNHAGTRGGKVRVEAPGWQGCCRTWACDSGARASRVSPRANSPKRWCPS